MLWIEKPGPERDYYVAFRGHIELAQDTEVELRTLASGWFVLWLDGEYTLEGPVRYEPAHPQYDVTRLKLAAGRHVLAVQAHHIGVETRMLPEIPPFFYGHLFAGERELSLAWKALHLPGYASQVRRINPELGWIEWCDTRANPVDWQAPAFDDAAWVAPGPATTTLAAPAPVTIGPVQYFKHPAQMIAEGPLAAHFGYQLDDVPARFFLRDLACQEVPQQGVWRRYDLGRVRLARPRFVLDLPAGTEVEFATCEQLMHGRVSPWINLSAGPSCNLDHYVARGGPQEFFPLTPKGGRFVEVHILAPQPGGISTHGQIKFVKEEFIERSYYGEAQGAFTCDDELLNRIWRTGVETLRACAEDGLVDNPTRERGQWTGDVVSVGMKIAGASYSDLRLLRRALVQSSWCARSDGLIAGLCPGGLGYVPSFAALWINACLHYHELTGDATILDELYPAAQRNLAYFEALLTDDGLLDKRGPDFYDWTFIDWGYARNPEPADLAMNLLFLITLQGIKKWAEATGHGADSPRYERAEQRVRAAIRRLLDVRLTKGETGWAEIGYHSAILALAAGFFSGTPDATRLEAECIRYVKRHILSCFPNQKDAPRNADPALACRQLITPYFAHYAFPPLIEHGEMDFVLDQYHTCWGWALEGGRTTWVEVFDTRWSHCHQWGGCPTWQLTRYGLGLHPRFDLGAGHFALALCPGSLNRAEGRVPLPDGQTIQVRWQRQADGIHYSFNSPAPVFLHLPAGLVRGTAGEMVIEAGRDYQAVLDPAWRAAGAKT